jgi:hypothetical protein
MMMVQVIHTKIRKISLKNTSNKISNYLPCKSKNSFYYFICLLLRCCCCCCYCDAVAAQLQSQKYNRKNDTIGTYLGALCRRQLHRFDGMALALVLRRGRLGRIAGSFGLHLRSSLRLRLRWSANRIAPLVNVPAQ